MNDFLHPSKLVPEATYMAPCQRCPNPRNPSSKNGLCKACDASYYRKRKKLQDQNPQIPPLTVSQFIRQFPQRDLERKRSLSITTKLPVSELIPGFIFLSPSMRRMADLVERVARKDATILITGETGTGKELVAQAIHKLSPRSDGPMGIVDCTTLRHELAESELFGHVRGAFTGAVNTRKGLFSDAHSGTIFLDELSQLPPDIQSMLLRILEQRQSRAVGSTRYESLDIRVIGATNESLRKLVDQGRFRADLYYRLNVVEIRVPPLRERKEDIPVLANHMLERLGEGNPWITPEAMKMLHRYDWPGNVRELRNILERALVMRHDDELPITPEELPEELFS